MDFKTLHEFDLRGKVVLLRADLNVPTQNGRVTDTMRIDRLKSTIDYLSLHGARTLILSHFGRPKGKYEEEFSMKFLPTYLEKSWGTKVIFCPDCIGNHPLKLAMSMQNGQFALMENVRFHKGEEANDPAFAKELAKPAQFFINDAFSAAHRAHASTVGLTTILPSAAGLLMEAELNALTSMLESPMRPMAAVVGGAKVSTKLSVLNNIVPKVDFLILAGGMANTFLFAQGHDMGQSLCEKEMADEARKIMQTAIDTGCEIILPVDCVATTEFKEGSPAKVCEMDKFPSDHMTMDAGPRSIERMISVLQGVTTVLWNGPLGVFEMKPFDKGTNEVAQAVAKLSKEGKVTSVAGGGDTVSALENAGAVNDFTYVSTAGGAFLEWMEGKELPGVAALTIST